MSGTFRTGDNFATERLNLLAALAQSVHDERVLDAMGRVPREAFVPPEFRSAAYKDVALPIGEGQTISQPLIVAQMTSAIDPGATDRVLEVGTGSGYQAAVLSLLVAGVISVERNIRLANSARKRLAELGYGNIRVELAADGLGWPAEAPYDGILVAAGAPALPLALVSQLRVGGRMAVPVGARRSQDLLLVTRTKGGHSVQDLGRCAFVPLIGEDAWPGPA